MKICRARGWNGPKLPEAADTVETVPNIKTSNIVWLAAVGDGFVVETGRERRHLEGVGLRSRDQHIMCLFFQVKIRAGRRQQATKVPAKKKWGNATFGK
mmetsp:Transcript_5924/g.16661  ORF Transcript_5924/g.16661 Transcript_5924/m.16661 type:complete len:99 (+) Transcript_5924:2347-2643(+)